MLTYLEGPSLNSPSTSQAYRSRIRTEPTNVTAPQWSAALWARLEVMFQEMADCCIKVYALEKVLKMKKDASTHVVFLDEAMKVGCKFFKFTARILTDCLYSFLRTIQVSHSGYH